MQARAFLMFATAMVIIALFRATPGDLMAASAPAALSGVVSAQEEGKMEGVLITARRDGANFTVSVVSDAQGKDGFPRTHLESGKYTLAMRAVGLWIANTRSARLVKVEPLD